MESRPVPLPSVCEGQTGHLYIRNEEIHSLIYRKLHISYMKQQDIVYPVFLSALLLIFVVPARYDPGAGGRDTDLMWYFS